MCRCWKSKLLSSGTTFWPLLEADMQVILVLLLTIPRALPTFGMVHLLLHPHLQKLELSEIGVRPQVETTGCHCQTSVSSLVSKQPAICSRTRISEEARFALVGRSPGSSMKQE